MQWRIIIIGKDLKFCKQLKYDLQDDTLQCYYALSLDDGLRHLIHYPYRLVVFESLSISADTLNQVAQIRKVCPGIHIVALCPLIDPQDLAAVLTVAENCLPLPYDSRTYKKILEAILQRSVYADPLGKDFLISRDGNLLIDPLRRAVQMSGKEITLQRRQFNLLYFLTANEGMVFSREQLHQRLWGEFYEGCDHTLSSHVSSLRSKLRVVDRGKNYIRTEYGIGYCFDSSQLNK